MFLSCSALKYIIQGFKVKFKNLWVCVDYTSFNFGVVGRVLATDERHFPGVVINAGYFCMNGDTSIVKVPDNHIKRLWRNGTDPIVYNEAEALDHALFLPSGNAFDCLG